MTIVTLSFPAGTITRALKASKSGSRSPFSLSLTQYFWGGYQWVYTFNTVAFELELGGKALSARLNQFLASGEPFLLADPTARNTVFSMDPAPTLANPILAGVSSFNLTLTGSGAFKSGDFISLARGDGFWDFHQIVEALPRSGANQAITVVPPIKRNFLTSTVLEAEEPLVTLVLSPSNQNPHTFNYPFQVQYTINAEEVF